MTTTTREHPVYTAAAAEIAAGRGWGWIDTADVAKLVRADLARRWPAVRFYVRMERYAGGSSIDVSYDGVELDGRGRALLTLVDYDGQPLDGAPVITQDEYRPSDPGRWRSVPRAGMPTRREIECVLAGYSGQRFDGMIDMAYGVSSWLNPDGTVTLGASPGTGDQRGSDPGYIKSRQHPSALLVHMGAGYLFVRDELPYGVKSR